jgi:WD40 repeat protein
VLVAAYLLMLAADPVLRSPEEALPPGAIARLGSVRMARPVRSGEQFHLTPDGSHALILPGSSGFQRTSPEWWDLEKGRRVPPPFFPPMGSRFAGITAAGIITSDNKGFQLRHPKTGVVLFTVPLTESTRRNTFVPVFNHDGTIAVMLTGNRLAIVRKQPDGSPLRAELPITIENSWAVAHRGGAIVWSDGSEIKRYDIGTGATRLVTKLTEPLNVPAYLDIHPDGSAIVVVRRDRNYDLPPECQLFLGTNPVGKTLASPKQTDSFGRIQFSSDGSKLYTVAGNEAAVWSFETGELLYEYLSPNAMRLVPSLDCRRLLQVQSNGQLRLIDWMTGESSPPHTPTRQVHLRSVRWIDDRVVLATANESREENLPVRSSLIRWDTTTGTDGTRITFDDKVPWYVTAISPDGRRAVLGDYRAENYRIRIWDIDANRTLGEWTDSNTSEGFAGPFSPDGKTILARKNGQTGLFTLDGQRCLVTLTLASSQRGRRSITPVPANAKFSPDGRLILASQSIGIVAYESATGLPRYIIPTYGSNNRFSNSFGGGGGGGFGIAVMSWDGHRVIVETEGRSMLFDPLTGTVHRFVDFAIRGRNSESGAMALSREGRWLAVVRSDSQDLVLYDVDASPGPEIVHTFRGMTGAISALAFRPDDQVLASVSTDGTAVTWDVGRVIARYRERTAKNSDGDWWNDLAADSLRAGRAMAAMIEHHPARAVVLLGERLFVPAAVDPARVKTWIADLDAPEPATREFAQASLRPVADQAAPALRTALASTNSAEVRKRVNGLLELVDGPETDPSRLRTIRAIEILERIGTPEARAVLSRLANGPAHAKATLEAATALKRLTP